MDNEQRMGLEEASRVIKEQAAKQPLRVDLTDEQLAALREQWATADPRQPLEITFLVAGKPVGDLKVASCAYISDTCCA